MPVAYVFLLELLSISGVVKMDVLRLSGTTLYMVSPLHLY